MPSTRSILTPRAIFTSVGLAAAALLIVGCGGGVQPHQAAASGGGDSPAAGSSNGTIKASNIVLKSGTYVATDKDGFIRVQANQLPDNVKVLASNVSIENGSNGLTASNLQDALDKEIAVNLHKTIVGVWDITNLPGNGTCQMKSTGQVQINADGTFKVLKGGFAAASSAASDEVGCYSYFEHSFQVVADGAGVLFTNSKPTDPMFPNGAPITALPIVVKATAHSITLFNGGSLSILTRAGGTQPVSAPAALQPVTRSKTLVALG